MFNKEKLPFLSQISLQPCSISKLAVTNITLLNNNKTDKIRPVLTKIVIRKQDTAFPLTQSQFLNLLAIDLLEEMGNTEPTQAEINAAEAFIQREKSQEALKERHKGIKKTHIKNLSIKEVTNDILGHGN